MSLNGLSKSNNTASGNLGISKNIPMNNTKRANTVSNNSSFTMAPAVTTAFNNAVSNVKNVAANAVNTVNEVATNAANSVKDTFNSDSFSGIAEPIKESINESIENDSLVTIPIMITLGVLLIVLILLIMFRDQIAFGLSVAWQKIKDLFAGSPSPSPSAPAPPSPAIDNGAISKMLPGKKEVFNIAADKYTYTDAEPLCKAFGAELATYDQVKDAWNKGADWCNYGWVKGQSAVYPTQQVTYDKLQAGPEDQRSACGVPGVNGGYFDNPELQFGVNCYGAKPSENDADIRFASDKHNLTPGALAYDKKVQDYKNHMNEIPVSAFKTGAWSS